MNKKTLAPIITTAVVLVVLLVAFLLIKLIPEAESPDVSPSPTSTPSQTVYLYQEDYYDLKKMEFEFRDVKISYRC